MHSKKLWALLATEDKDFLLDLQCKFISSKESLFDILFDHKAAYVGQVITLEDVFRKTYKSKRDIDRYFKYWKKSKGIVVSYHLKLPMQESYYIIDKIIHVNK